MKINIILFSEKVGGRKTPYDGITYNICSKFDITKQRILVRNTNSLIELNTLTELEVTSLTNEPIAYDTFIIMEGLKIVGVGSFAETVEAKIPPPPTPPEDRILIEGQKPEPPTHWLTSLMK